jgi:hypothetical protein
VVVKGQCRPEYLTPLTRGHALFRHTGSHALVHSRDVELRQVVRLGEAALSGLDGEQWQRFAADSWEADAPA